MNQEERIKQLARDVLPRLGHTNSVVICPKPVSVDFIGEVGTACSPIPKWTIRATDDQKQTCRIETYRRPRRSRRTDKEKTH